MISKPLDPRVKPALELWGGVECTFNRVHDTYFSQLKWNGHLNRLEDLDYFAELGVKALRYPVIWEMLAPQRPDEINWTFPDERLPRLRELNIRPIAGLVHHGSGPGYAPIDSPQFVTGLKDYARRVAQRYPWIQAYTPVNEPLTTARFCGLYGHWYPHGQSDAAFVRVLLNECRATIEAMAAIREVNSSAELVQTEDLGYVYSTPKLAYQAHFENLRRWLSFDLLCGRVDAQHEMWDYLIESGADPRELDWFCENPCTPDIFGINHYPTSDRFLDEDFEKYHDGSWANNGRENYADVEAVRVLPNPPGGFKDRLCETWHRYEMPLAITEAHLGCSREEQFRWLNEAWKSATDLHAGGVPIRAVTPWSFLGAWNWNSLVTQDAGYYEPGVFDTRGPKPRPTALAKAIKALSTGEVVPHPILHQPGWWQRPERLFGSPQRSWELPFIKGGADLRSQSGNQNGRTSPPLIILGKNGVLSQAIAQACDIRGLPYYLLGRRDLDIRDLKSIETFLTAMSPWAVINATGYSDIARAEAEADACFSINTQGAINLATVCARHDFKLACFSSDHVFDGDKATPYFEFDRTAPINVFGKSKASMEEKVLATHPSALVARTGPLFSTHGERDFLTQSLAQLKQNGHVEVAQDAILSPTFAPDLASAILDLLIDGECGLWNLVNDGQTSWVELAQVAAQSMRISGDIQAVTQTFGPAMDEPHHKSRVLGTERGLVLATLDDAVSRYCQRTL